MYLTVFLIELGYMYFEWTGCFLSIQNFFWGGGGDYILGQFSSIFFMFFLFADNLKVICEYLQKLQSGPENWTSAKREESKCSRMKWIAEEHYSRFTVHVSTKQEINIVW